MSKDTWREKLLRRGPTRVSINQEGGKIRIGPKSTTKLGAKGYDKKSPPELIIEYGPRRILVTGNEQRASLAYLKYDRVKGKLPNLILFGIGASHYQAKKKADQGGQFYEIIKVSKELRGSYRVQAPGIGAGPLPVRRGGSGGGTSIEWDQGVDVNENPFSGFGK